MGRQSSRLWFGRDHKDIYFDGHYHKAMYLTDSYGVPSLVWEKLSSGVPTFSFVVQDTMEPWEDGREPNHPAGTIAFSVQSVSTVIPIVIDWGDGTSEETFGFRPVEGKYVTHTYPTANKTKYIVTIRGDFQSFNSAHYSNGYYESSICEILTPAPKVNTIYGTDHPEAIPTFYYSKLIKSIPSDFFSNLAGLDLYLSGTFSGTGISEIPKGLFDNIGSISGSGIFAECNSLTKIEGDMFARTYPKGDMSRLFNGTGISEIPANIFANFEDVENLSDCFANTNIAYIPSGLFSNCPNVRYYNGTFENTRIEQIPGNLFDVSYNALGFARTFKNSAILRSIPQGLFDALPNVNDFSETFRYCRNVQGNVPELWQKPNVTRHDYCFQYCDNASNYNDIPYDWR